MQLFNHYDGTIVLSQDKEKLIIDVNKPVEKFSIFGNDDDSSCSSDMDSLKDQLDLGDDVDAQMDELRIKKEQDGEEHKHAGNTKKLITYKQHRSSASCLIKDIKGFVYGGFSSRFWILRK